MIKIIAAAQEKFTDLYMSDDIDIYLVTNHVLYLMMNIGNLHG